MAIIVANQARSHTKDGYQPETAGGNWTWVGLSTPLDRGGRVTFYNAREPKAGAEIVTICLGPGQQQLMGPLAPQHGVCWDSPTGGSALVWFKEKDKT